MPPIYYPPSGSGRPPGIWGGGNEPFPTPPIHLPPEYPIPEGKVAILVWTPDDGFQVKVIEKPPGYNPPPGAAVPTPQEA
jgi:hypothetical protein